MNAALYAFFTFSFFAGCNNPFSDKSLVEGGFAPPKLSEESPAIIPDATPTPLPTPTSAPTPTPTPLTITFGSINDITTFGMSSTASVNVSFTYSGASSLTCSSSHLQGSATSGVSLTFSGTYPSCIVTVPIVGGSSGSVVVTLQPQTSVGVGSRSFTINVLPAAQVAYSLRQVVRGYTGSAIRVCLTSTCTSQTDIGFDANGDLDQSALSSFCGANSCFVRTWYDQSGNGRNAVQTTNSQQPLIFSSSAIMSTNGKPTVRFDGTSDYMAQTGYSYSFDTFNAVWRWNNTITESYAGLTGQRTANSGFVANSDTFFVLGAGSNGAPNQTNISEHAASVTAAWINSSAVSSLANFNSHAAGVAFGTSLGILSVIRSIAPSGVKNLTIGADGFWGPGRYGAVDISELYFLSSLSTSDRNLLESDQRSYYATP